MDNEKEMTLKDMAKVTMFNPESGKAQQVIMEVANHIGMHPLMVLAEIDKLTEGERL